MGRLSLYPGTVKLLRSPGKAGGFPIGLNKAKFDKLSAAIDEHKCNYKILHGKFSERLLDDYICTFETLGNLVQDNIITKEMAYNEGGYELEKTWCNQDVQNFIQESRKADKNISGPTAFYIGFEQMAKYSLYRDKKTCSDMDDE